MEYKRFGDTLVVRMDPGEEILEQLKAVAQKEHIALASIQALGAVQEFTAGVFDLEKKQFLPRDYTGTFEIVSLTGTIDSMGGDFYCHLHMSAADETGQVFGGHLSRAVVSATCEMVITCIPGRVDRRRDEAIGLNLLQF